MLSQLVPKLGPVSKIRVYFVTADDRLRALRCGRDSDLPRGRRRQHQRRVRLQPVHPELDAGHAGARGGEAGHPRAVIAHPGRHRVPASVPRRRVVGEGVHGYDHGAVRPGLRQRSRVRRRRCLRVGSSAGQLQPRCARPAGAGAVQPFRGALETAHRETCRSEEGIAGFSAAWALFADVLDRAGSDAAHRASPPPLAHSTFPRAASPMAPGCCFRRHPASSGRTCAPPRSSGSGRRPASASSSGRRSTPPGR